MILGGVGAVIYIFGRGHEQGTVGRGVFSDLCVFAWG